jgi:RNA polymerase sigma-70 factor (ECF subfamily)
MSDPALPIDPIDGWVELVEQIRNGGQAGDESLYALLNSRVRGRLYRSIDPQAVEDRMQEIVVVVLEAIKSGELRDARRLMGFVSTVARRQVAAEIRSAILRRRRLAASHDCESAESSTASPEARMAQIERVERMLLAVDRLKKRDRQILLRFYLQEQSAEQICLDMSLSHTQFRLYKSRALARCLDLIRNRRKSAASHSTKWFKIA